MWAHGDWVAGTTARGAVRCSRAEDSCRRVAPAPATETTAPLRPPDYSGTNTQEVGVDEGDIVETNGTHVFVAVADGVRIVEVDDATG